MNEKAGAAIIAALALCACGGPSADELPVLIPQPLHVSWHAGTCRLPESLVISADDEGLVLQAEYLAEALSPYAETSVTEDASGYVRLSTDPSMAPEEYALSVKKSGISISGGSDRGVVNGIATLRQLLPAESVSSPEIPCVRISDRPAFGWRGVMLDVSRHFFDKEEIFMMLDQMAMLKLNKFHWHLTDDQGWRIEIKGYPDLTEKGGWRQFNKHDEICMERAAAQRNPDYLLPEKYLRTEGSKTLYGGFYTQDDIREIVAYAAARGIDVIPEIDMPGHFLQAIEHYPELTCFEPQTWTGEAFSSPLCLGKDDVLDFCEEVWEEVFELFPYEYVHIGGDEVNMKNWNRCPLCQARMKKEGLADGHALQAWFTHRMQDFFEANGKRMIGWDELLQGEVTPSTTIMWWRPWMPESVPDATALGCDVILCPQSWFYFSLEEDSGSLIRTSNYDMVPDSLSAGQKSRILGVQGNVWTERVPSWSRVEYMFYPRLLIVAEKGWCPPESVNDKTMIPRLYRYCERLDAQGINYRIPTLENFHEFCVFTDSISSTVTCPLPSAILRYTLDDSVPDTESPVYTGPITFYDDAVLTVRAFHADGRTGDWVRIAYDKCGYAGPVEVEGVRPGLHAEWYFKRFPKCDAVAGARPDGTCVVDTVQFPDVAKGRRATGIIFRGYIDVPEDGIYTFALASNDGSLLRIDGRLVIDNDGEHTLIEKTGQAAMSAGLHPFELRYFDYNGGRVTLALVDENGNRVPFGDGWFFYKED